VVFIDMAVPSARIPVSMWRLLIAYNPWKLEKYHQDYYLLRHHHH
ncbi:unnamed protein product, partial [Allacma fusca]